MFKTLYIYLLLFTAIACETIATVFLKQSEQFTKPLSTLATVIGYIVSSYLLAIVVKTIPVSIAYAIWGALGILFITAIGTIFFNEQLDIPAYIGIGLIISGVLIINIFSQTVKN